MAVSTVQAMIKKTLTSRTSLSPRTLRHTFASQFLNQKQVSLAVVMGIDGLLPTRGHDGL